MIRIAIFISLLLTMTFAAALMLVRGRAYVPQVDWLIDGCALPCWRGIQPGAISVGEALARLRAMEDVLLVESDPAPLTSATFIRWQWRSGGGRGGLLIIIDGVVQDIFLETPLLMGDLWLELGAPAGGTVAVAVSRTGAGELMDTSIYPALGVSTIAYVGCPLRLPRLWTAPASIWLRASGAARFDYIPLPGYVHQLSVSFMEGSREFCR